MRAQRSNPESLRGKILDCFAALAMTRLGFTSRHSLAIVPPTCRSINPKAASIDTALNLDTLPRAPLGVAVGKRFEF
ncbi:hypothetical protein C7G41_35115 [Bradyrhizobium sp. MOS002]|nr:hypothetical protein C7G41_35115 [Bradyrhizobium sp. MOS002]